MYANAVTALRYPLSVALLGLVLVDNNSTRIAALVVVCAIGLSDHLDGRTARRTLPTPEGAVFDPLADEFAVTTGFICLLSVGALPLWFALLAFWSRSAFALVRMLTLVRRLPYAAPRISTKLKMAGFYAGMIVLFATRALADQSRSSVSGAVADAAVGIMTALTVIAAIDFLVITHRAVLLDLFRKSTSEPTSKTYVGLTTQARPASNAAASRTDLINRAS